MIDAEVHGSSTPSSLATSSRDGLDAVQWCRPDGTVMTAAPDRRLLGQQLWQMVPVRAGVQYPNRRNRHGLYFWAASGEHVWHESALELAALVELDYAGEAVRVAAQPFRLLFRTGAAASFHDPDFFAVHGNGDQVVYDVKPAARVDKASQQFAETARVCAAVGWRHDVERQQNESAGRQRNESRRQ